MTIPKQCYVDLYAALWNAAYFGDSPERYAKLKSQAGQLALFTNDTPAPVGHRKHDVSQEARDEGGLWTAGAAAPEKPSESVESEPSGATITAGGTGEPAEEPKAEGVMKVQNFRRNDFTKATEQTPEKMARWQKPGHVIVVGRDGGPMHQTFDPSSPVTIRTRKIGAELPEGTVVDKRLVHGDEGLRVEYLVKPRRTGDEANYADQRELARLEELLRIDPDAPTEDRDRWRQQIADIQARMPTATPEPKPKVARPAPEAPTPLSHAPSVAKPAPREPTELETLKGQARGLQGLLDRGAAGRLGEEYASRLEAIKAKIAEIER